MRPSRLSIIFDMDGTLCDTAIATTAASNEILHEMGLEPIDIERSRRAIGWSGPEIFFKLLPGHNEETVLRFGENLEEVEARYIKEQGGDLLFSGVLEMLEALHAEGIPLHIASTGSPSHVKQSLEITDTKQFFESISCGQPDKIDMVSEIIRTNDPEGFWIMVGDKVKDSDAAHGNDILAVGAGYGYCFEDEHHLFDRVAATPKELLALLLSYKNA